jgi:hypothetical protein
MHAASSLHAGLLVGAEHVVVLAERLAVEGPCVEVEHSGCCDGEMRVAREDPRSMLSRLERVSGQPAAHRGG